jgi:RNA polymerase sigma-70 factor (ECF subfamily)
VKTSERELLQRWRSGDRTAGDTLIGHHFTSVYRFFINKVPDRVDDLCQRTFLGCLEALPRVDEQRDFRAYLLGIARNLLLMHYRSHHGRDMVDLESIPTERLGHRMSPFLVARQEHRILLAALRKLPLHAQEVLEFHYWEGLTAREIGTVMGLAEGSVRSRLSRARVALRTAIASVDATEALKRSTLDNLERWATAVRETFERTSGGS